MLRRLLAASVFLAFVFFGSRISHVQQIFSFELATTPSLAQDTPGDGNKAADSAKAEGREPETSPVPERELCVPKGIRAIFFIPHPDDESLGTAGLIQRVIENEGRVCVVFMTNGDGYVEGVRLKCKRKETSSQDFVEYGRMRQEEALQAVCQLGVNSEDVVFLGFPDDGIDDLWSDYWSRLKPFTSPHTRFSRAEYKNSYSRLAQYAGADLEEMISQVLRGFNPDWVILPDPRDFHPDHCTTGIFVLDAARHLNQRGEVSFTATRFLTYLVHYIGYPTSGKWLDTIRNTGIGCSKTASRLLSQTRWRSLPLTANELENKKSALYAHQSQIGMLGWFFKDYLRPCEVFGQLDPMQVLAIPQVYAAQFHRTVNVQ